MAAPPTLSPIEALPHELTDKIFTYLDKPVNGRYYSSSPDFFNLRQVSKTIYEASQHEFYYRTGNRFGYIEPYHKVYATFELAPKDLKILLRLTESPILRNKFESLEFGPRWSIKPDKLSVLNAEIEVLLTRIFENFAKSSKLVEVKVYDIHYHFFTAVQNSGFKRTIFHLSFRLSDRFSTVEPKAEPHSATAKFLQQTTVESIKHHKDPPPLTIARRRLLDIGSTSPTVLIEGCDGDWTSSGHPQPNPHHKVCHGCEQLVYTGLLQNHFANLTNLTINGVYIHSGALHRFLNAHKPTLQSLHMIQVYLISGRWEILFKTMLGLSQLDSLSLACLYQKPGDGETINVDPKRMSRVCKVEIKGGGHILQWLQVSREKLGTYVFERMRYKEIRLLELPDVVSDIQRSPWWEFLRLYENLYRE